MTSFKANMQSSSNQDISLRLPSPINSSMNKTPVTKLNEVPRGVTSAQFSSDHSSSALSKDASRAIHPPADEKQNGPKVERLSNMFNHINKKKKLSINAKESQTAAWQSKQVLSQDQIFNNAVAILKKNPEARNERDLNQIIPFIKENPFFKHQNQIQLKHLTEICSELRYEFMPAGTYPFFHGDFRDKFYLIIQGKVSILEKNEQYIKLKKELEIQKHHENNPFGKPKKNAKKFDAHQKGDHTLLHRESHEIDSFKEHSSERQNREKSIKHDLHAHDYEETDGEKPSLHMPTKHSNHNQSIEHLNNNDGHVSFRQPRKHSQHPEEDQDETSHHQVFGGKKSSIESQDVSIAISELPENPSFNDTYFEDILKIKYTEIDKLKDGDHFGEAALIEHKPRNCTALCRTDCHFAILSREDFERSLGAIERRKFNERIQFLQSLPYFDRITRNSVGKISYQFQDIETIKSQYLYREGEAADSVYLVKEGQFEVTRTMLYNEDPGQKTKQIFTNPMRANKVSGSAKLKSARNIKHTQLFRFEKGNIIGDEDLIAECPEYRTTVKCVSLTGLVGKMKREDFMRLEIQPYTWNALTLNAKNKEQAINKHLQLKNTVETGIHIGVKIPLQAPASHTAPTSPGRPGVFTKSDGTQIINEKFNNKHFHSNSTLGGDVMQERAKSQFDKRGPGAQTPGDIGSPLRASSVQSTAMKYNVASNIKLSHNAMPVQDSFVEPESWYYMQQVKGIPNRPMTGRPSSQAESQGALRKTFSSSTAFNLPARGAYDKRFRQSMPNSPLKTIQNKQMGNTFMSQAMLHRNHSIDPNRQQNMDTALNFFRQAPAYQRPDTAQTFRRNALMTNSRMTPHLVSQPMHNASASSMQASHTLLQSLLLNKGKQVMMPLASTFNRKNGHNMLSKDQLILLTKTHNNGFAHHHAPTESYLNTLIANNQQTM